MEYPVPNHLKDIYVIDEDKSDMYGLEGRLMCTCGCDEFGLEVYAEVTKKYISVKEKGTGWAFLIDSICKSCGRRYTVMDLSKHGFDGFVWEDGISVLPSELAPCCCPECGDSNFKLDLEIEVEDKEQWVEEVVEDNVCEYRKKFKPEDYVDAFNWIVISAHCQKCGHYYKRWVDLELS